MAWVKIPKEHHPIFLAAVPQERGVETIRMFGGLAAMVNGNMFGGLFARSALVRVNEADQATVLAMDGGAPFDPMGDGRTMKDTVMLPESVMSEPRELARWLDRALAFTRTLPPKVKKKKAAAAAKKPAKKPTTKPAKKPAPVATKKKSAKKAKPVAKKKKKKKKKR